MFDQKKIKKIGFISTRFHGTDGVTLETEKWVEVLKELEYDIFYFAGLSDRPPEQTVVEPLAFFDHPQISEIQKKCFGTTIREQIITSKIQDTVKQLKKSLYHFLKIFNIDLIIIENALSIPMNIPLGIALTELIAETGIPAIGHHHDLYWERQRFMVNCVNDYIRMAFPPSLPSIRHVVINSQSLKDLSYRRGLNSVLIPNVFNFSQDPPGIDEYNQSLRSDLGLSSDDLFILQPTRVIARKGIEHSIELAARMANQKAKLVITHQLKDEGKEYLNRIISYADLLKVQLVIRPEIIRNTRHVAPDGEKIYSLADLYTHADLVTYPSTYEGFGNAFLEAIYFKKPLFVNRYSIFQRDIEPHGFDVIMMETYINDSIINEVQAVLTDPVRRTQMTEKNFTLGKKHFSYQILKQNLQTIILFFEGE